MSDNFAALRGTISTLLENRAEFSPRTYKELPRQFLGSYGREENRPGLERTNPRKVSGPPYRIRDVTRRP